MGPMRAGSQSLLRLSCCFRLREEARKGWQDRVSNELVHLEQLVESEVIPLFLRMPSESDIGRSRVWIEMHLFLEGQRKSHYLAIFEFFNVDLNLLFGLQPNEPVAGNSMRHDVPMLVDVPKIMQAPEMGGFVSVSVLVRLKCLHNGDCRIGNSISGFSNSDLCVNRILFANREANIAAWGLTAQEGQLPSEMVKATPKRSDKVCRDQCNGENALIVRQLKPDNVPAVCRIFFGGHPISISFPESVDFCCERAQMFLRPSQLHFGVKKACHDAAVYFILFADSGI